MAMSQVDSYHERDRHRERERDRHHRRPRRSRSRSGEPPRRSRTENGGRAWTPPPTRANRAHASGWDIAADGSKVSSSIGLDLGLLDPNMNPERLALLGLATPLIKTPVNAMGQPIIIGQPSMQGPGGGPRADRQMRRLYAGNLPHTTEHDLMHFFNVAMRTALVDQPAGDSVVSVYLNMEKRFGFIEFRTVEEATAALALDGIVYGTYPLKIRRPSDYNPNAFPSITGPIPDIDVSRLGIVSTQVPDGPGKLFCGGLPYELNEEQVRELLEAYGPIKAFHLVREKDSNISKGYCFFEYQDHSISEAACQGLNNLPVGDRVLTVRPAYQKEDVALELGLPVPTEPPQNIVNSPSKVIILLEMVTEADLADDDEYQEIKEDIAEECGKYGPVHSCVIPRRGQQGCGKVFVAFDSVASASKARDALAGRRFASRTVIAQFYSEEKFHAGQFS